MTLSRHNLFGIGVGAALLAALALAAANFLGDTSGNGGVGPYVFTLGISIAIAVAVFGWAIPRSEHPARAGIVAGALAILSVAVFWTGVPYVLGPAAVALGLLGYARPQEKGAAVVAIVLGSLATVAAVAAVIIDQST